MFGVFLKTNKLWNLNKLRPPIRSNRQWLRIMLPSELMLLNLLILVAASLGGLGADLCSGLIQTNLDDLFLLKLPPCYRNRFRPSLFEPCDQMMHQNSTRDKEPQVIWHKCCELFPMYISETHHINTAKYKSDPINNILMNWENTLFLTHKLVYLDEICTGNWQCITC